MVFKTSVSATKCRKLREQKQRSEEIHVAEKKKNAGEDGRVQTRGRWAKQAVAGALKSQADGRQPEVRWVSYAQSRRDGRAGTLFSTASACAALQM